MTNECALWRGSMADYTQSCCSSADGATGVKQLSALAAAGEVGGHGGDVIEPGRLPKQRPSAGQLKAPPPLGVRVHSEQQWKSFVWLSWLNR